MKILIISLLLISHCFVMTKASADILDIEIVLKDHKFNPELIEIPSNQKIRLIVHNQDDSIEEFDSIDLKREKIIPGNSKAHIILAPLEAGNYEFVGEFHQETAKGIIVVK